MLYAESNLMSMFAYLDFKGGVNATAGAEVVLADGAILTVRAGGPGTHSRPAFAPFESYEVLTDHDPPRFWRRYADSGALYSQVPRLLVAHHVTRSGGIAQMSLSVSRVARTVMMNVSLMVDEDYAKLVREAVEKVASTKLISSNLSFQ